MDRLLEEFDDVWPELTAAIRHARETGEDEPLKRLIDEALLSYVCDGMESYTP